MNFCGRHIKTTTNIIRTEKRTVYYHDAGKRARVWVARESRRNIRRERKTRERNKGVYVHITFTTIVSKELIAWTPEDEMSRRWRRFFPSIKSSASGTFQNRIFKMACFLLSSFLLAFFTFHIFPSKTFFERFCLGFFDFPNGQKFI